MKMMQELEILLDEQEKRLRMCEAELAASPEGELYQVRRNGKLELYHATWPEPGHRVRKTITQSPEIAAVLARKAYLQAEMKLLEKNIPELRKLMLSTVQYATVAAEDVLQSMPERYRKLPEDWFFGQKTESMSSADLWAAAPYHQSDYKPEEKTKITSRGLHVRSMAEVVCCEQYYHHDVPFRYEAVLEIGGYSFVPDITSMRRRDSKIFYHEHCGLPHIPKYWERHKWKLRMYEQAGIVPWDNLIVTYGDQYGNVDVREIESQIINRLL